MKIQRLCENVAYQTGTAVSFQLDQEIQAAEAERDCIHQKIERLEREMISDLIHHELSRLNYFTQVQLFRQFLQDQRIGGFLIHGQPGYGQVHLVRRFLSTVPDGAATPLIQFYLSRRAIQTDIEALWRELGRQLQLDRLSARAEIVRQTIAQLKTQHIVLVFHDLDCIDAGYLDELAREFWLLSRDGETLS